MYSRRKSPATGTDPVRVEILAPSAKIENLFDVSLRDGSEIRTPELIIFSRKFSEAVLDLFLFIKIEVPLWDRQIFATAKI